MTLGRRAVWIALAAWMTAPVISTGGHATLTFTGPTTAKIKIGEGKGEVSLVLKRE